MRAFNVMLFNFFNASDAPSPLLVALAKALADWAVYAVALALVWGWVHNGGRSGDARRKRLFSVAATIILALAVNMLIGAFWYHPRPFEAGLGHQLLAHIADNSFPSDHATVMFAVALGMAAAQISALWTGLALALALGVAWARVYLGVHWPLDMAGSFLVALGASWLARLGMGTKAGRGLSRMALTLYDGLLNTLHIPASISPRSHP